MRGCEEGFVRGFVRGRTGGKLVRQLVKRTIAAAAVGGLTFGLCASHASADGTWEMAPVNPATGGQAFGLWLLTDGRVLSHGSGLNNWVILTPDAKGSYVNGTWKSVAS